LVGANPCGSKTSAPTPATRCTASTTADTVRARGAALGTSGTLERRPQKRTREQVMEMETETEMLDEMRASRCNRTPRPEAYTVLGTRRPSTTDPPPRVRSLDSTRHSVLFQPRRRGFVPCSAFPSLAVLTKRTRLLHEDKA
jgi:hypothetical protein